MALASALPDDFHLSLSSLTTSAEATGPSVPLLWLSIAKEKVILTLVKMVRKTLFGTISIVVKTIAVGERNWAQPEYSKDK